MNTPQQTDIVEASQSLQSLSVLARAGTGKTYTLCEVASVLPNGLALAFNKSIALELSSRLALESWDCVTFNALGFRECRSRGIYKTNPKKLDEIISDNHYRYPENTFVANFINQVKQTAYLPEQITESLFLELLENHEDTPDSWINEALADHATTLVDIFNSSISSNKELDFSDQIYYPIARRWSLDKYQTILVDESQDLSPLQHKFILGLRGPSTKVVTFGDPRQCIYAWRGADANSFYTLQASLEAEIFPLTLSFRCPQAVVKEANRIEPDFFAREDNPEGLVLYQTPQHLLSEVVSLSKESAILCRTNAPLVPYALTLLRANRPFTFKGKFPQRLQNFFYSLQYGEINQKIKSLEAKLDSMKPNRRASTIDLIQAVQMIQSRCSSMADIKLFIEKLKTGTTGVTLSTIHQSKGLEWPRLYFLHPSYLDLREISEQNLYYVAVTRSKDRLIYVD